MKKLFTMIILTTLWASSLWAHEVKSCGSDKSDILSAIHSIKNNWRNYENFVTDYNNWNNLSSCLENRFKKNGKVKCKNLSGNKAGLAYPGFLQIKLDTGWLSGLTNNQKNRRACIAALVAHEFAHTCFATEKRSDKIDKATFMWWKDRYNATNSWNSCGIYL